MLAVHLTLEALCEANELAIHGSTFAKIHPQVSQENEKKYSQFFL